jgi:hypothetical protein
MKIALDPYMLRRVPLTDLPGLVADLGYQYIRPRRACRVSVPRHPGWAGPGAHQGGGCCGRR